MMKRKLYTIFMAVEIGLNKPLRRNHDESEFALTALCGWAHYKGLRCDGIRKPS